MRSSSSCPSSGRDQDEYRVGQDVDDNCCVELLYPAATRFHFKARKKQAHMYIRAALPQSLM